MPQKIPVQDLPYFSQQIDLEDTTYTLTLRWNSREEAWYLDFDEQDGTSIVRGQKVLGSVNLTGRWADARMPKGALISLSSENVRPSRTSLIDDTLQILYYTEEEVSTIVSSV